MKILWVLIICILLLMIPALGIHHFSSFNISIPIKGKPVTFGDFLLFLTSDSRLAIVNQNFQIEKFLNFPKNSLITNYASFIEIASYESKGYVNYVKLYPNLETESSSISLSEELKNKKDVLFVNRDLLFDGSYLWNLTNGSKIEVPYKVKHISYDKDFLFIVDVFDKLHVLNHQGQSIGKYNLGANISGIVILDDSHLAVCSIKGLYIITKPDFTIKRKYDFPKTPYGLYYNYPYVIFSTIDKLYVYDYSSDKFLSFPYYRFLPSDMISEYEEYIWIENKKVNIGTLFYDARETEAKMINFDFCVHNNKIYALVLRKKIFNVDYYYYDYTSKKRVALLRSFYSHIREIIGVDPRTAVFHNRVIETQTSRYDNIYPYRNYSYYDSFLVSWNNQLILLKSYKDYTSFFYVDF